jgi:splicing factor U2AF subunit
LKLLKCGVLGFSKYAFDCNLYRSVEGLNVCDNLADHMVGSVYVKYREEESALAALNALSGRFYAGRPILCEFSPVTDFRESTCRQYEENTCTRGGYCNFMHLKPISRNLRKILFGRYKRRDDRDRDRERGERGDDRGSRGRGDERGRERGGDERERGRGGGGGGGSRERDDRGGGRGRERSRSRSRERGRGGGRDDRGDDRVTAKGMTDDERRAMFAKWNDPAEQGGGGEGGGGGGDAAAAAADGANGNGAGGAPPYVEVKSEPGPSDGQ